MDLPVIAIAVLLFFLRVLNNGMFTIRMILITRGRKTVAAIFAFIEATIFALTTGLVVNDLTNPVILIAYSGGFAVGGYFGQIVESRFVKGYLSVNVVSPGMGHEIAVALRDAGFGVTETNGEGKDGHVMLVRCIIERRAANEVIDIIRGVSPDAFISVEETRTVRSGYVRSVHGRATN